MALPLGRTAKSEDQARPFYAHSVRNVHKSQQNFSKVLPVRSVRLRRFQFLLVGKVRAREYDVRNEFDALPSVSLVFQKHSSRGS
jgi:hypothetical protein